MVKVCLVGDKYIGFKPPLTPDTVTKLKLIPSFQYSNLNKIYIIHLLHYPLLKDKFSIKVGFIEDRYKKLYMKQNIKIDVQLINSKLLEYQKEGVAKLVNNNSFILADDTGLGKSLQGLAAIKHLNIKKILIVTLSSLKQQWYNENEFFIGKKSIVINGTPAKRKKQWLSDNEIFFCNYETLIKDLVPYSINFDVIILDEGQKIKNPSSKINKNINKLSSKYKWVLSATPIENSLTDLYTLLNFIEPLLFTSYYKFLDMYTIKRTVTIKNHSFQQIVGFKNTEELKNTIAPIMLRREKKDVLSELPPITEQNRIVALLPDQAKQYKSIIKLIKQSMNDNEKMKVILAQISLLKSCVNGTQILKQSESIHITDIYFPEKDESAKLNELDDIIPTLTGQTIIFSESVRMCNLVADKLNIMKIGNVMVTGQDDANSKEVKVNDFMQGKYKMLVASNAIAYGKNIQCAQNIINIDLPWNPAILKNRISRIYRMKQQNNVLVINILTDSSIDNRITNKLKMKTNLFDITIPDKMDMNYISKLIN